MVDQRGRLHLCGIRHATLWELLLAGGDEDLGLRHVLLLTRSELTGLSMLRLLALGHALTSSIRRDEFLRLIGHWWGHRLKRLGIHVLDLPRYLAKCTLGSIILLVLSLVLGISSVASSSLIGLWLRVASLVRGSFFAVVSEGLGATSLLGVP